MITNTAGQYFVQLSIHDLLIYPGIHQKYTDPTYLFCNQSAASEGLYESAIKQLDKKAWKCARDTDGISLIAKLAALDLVAIEAKIHIQMFM